jgi:hypothetical protein
VYWQETGRNEVQYVGRKGLSSTMQILRVAPEYVDSHPSVPYLNRRITTQNPVTFGSCGFDSHLRHHLSNQLPRLAWVASARLCSGRSGRSILRTELFEWMHV